MKPFIGRAAAWYQAQVGNELRKYGLRYEDLLDPGMSLVLSCGISISSTIFRDAEDNPIIALAAFFWKCLPGYAIVFRDGYSTVHPMTEIFSSCARWPSMSCHFHEMLPQIYLLMQDVAEAIQRLPVHEQDLRLQRLKRATDCSLKKQYLPKELQAQQTPWNFYIDVSLIA